VIPTETSCANPVDDMAGMRPRRRGLLRGVLALSITAAAPGVALAPARSAAVAPPMRAVPPTGDAAAADRAEWAAFRDRFVTPEGRVVDTGNGHVSHSEGQGFAMVLAEWADDRAAFERLLAWTRGNLSRPRDALFAWRWQPGRPVPVEDLNSATDGDIMIAWALLRASERWSVPAWRRMATAITQDILRLSVKEVAGRMLLLPGPGGFDKVDRVIVNPSYYNLPALRALAALVPSLAWDRLLADAPWLLDAACFGHWSVPADWVEVMKSGGRVQLAAGWPPRFSWDAVRVPLHLAWAGETDAPAVLRSAVFWSEARAGVTPAWVDLRSGSLAPYAGHAGIVAVAALSAAAAGGAPERAVLPALDRATDYYAGALVMLARLARQEGAIAASPQARMMMASR
jgi:endoglucanase